MKHIDEMSGTHIKISASRRLFLIFDYIFLACAALLCLLPMINVLAVSLSSSNAAAAGYVKLWPVEFTLSSYEYALGKPQFLQAFLKVVRNILVNHMLGLKVLSILK